MATTLTTAASSQVILINGAQVDNVFWQAGSSAMLGGSSVFQGNILALTSIEKIRQKVGVMAVMGLDGPQTCT